MRAALAEMPQVPVHLCPHRWDWDFAVGAFECGNCGLYKPFRPLHETVLLRVLHPERMTASKTLYIPDSAQREPHELYQGIVLACGPGLRGSFDTLKDRGVVCGPDEDQGGTFYSRLHTMDVKPGDRVLYYWAAGKIHTTFWPDENHFLVPEQYIQAVIEE